MADWARSRAATAAFAAAVLVSGCGRGSSPVAPAPTNSTSASSTSVNSATANSATVNSATVNSATANSATVNSATVNSATPSSTQTAAASGAVTGTSGGTGISASAGATGTGTGTGGLPRFSHIVVVVEENKPFGKLVGTRATPFLTDLAGHGAVLTQSYAITHPSEPNYLALFSGSTQGLTSDSCPHRFTGPNLGAALIAAGHTFVGYSESLPGPGYQGCSNGDYARKHSPWVDFPLPTTVNQPLTAFPADLADLPDLSFVIPNLQDDMHDGSIAKGDRWLAAHLSTYRDWAATHDSLLVVTTDEDDDSHANHITTILAGAHVAPGRYATRTDHYGMLRTLLASFGLAPFGRAAATPAITAIWAR